MIYAIFVLAVISWILGGQRGKLRDIPFPILIGLGVWLRSGSWLAGLLSIVFWQIIRLGYGNMSLDDEKPSFLGVLTQDTHGWWIRLIYGLLCALLGAFPLVIVYTFPIWLYCLYGVGNGLIGFFVSRFRLNVYLTDVLVGAGFASVLFLI